MKRYRQTIQELRSALSPIRVSWKDNHAKEVLDLLASMKAIKSLTKKDLRALFENDFPASLTVARLCLELSKDEFIILLRNRLDASPTQTTFKNEPQKFIDTLVELGVSKAFSNLVNARLTWRDIIEERLKGGRGSAIKGQARGRFLEDFVERIVNHVFGAGQYDPRCNFSGVGGKTGKADFAIPNRNDPRILIEVKAYGATGSKQTDVLGDVNNIVAAKRHDTQFLLVTDGITW